MNVGTKMNANKNGGAKMSVRNLRIREDTAKYLLNLDVNSAYYDPKTRSMRDNPLNEGAMRGGGGGGDGGASGSGAVPNFMPYNVERNTGDARKLAEMQLYEMEANAKGQSLHLQADPTSIELMNKIYREKKESLQATKKNKVLEKYGGQEHLEQPPTELLFAQTEDYAEYTRAGALVHGKERPVAKSKYEEDVHAHNHTCIWGSFFDRQTFKWGYADDHATIRNAYGTGEAGKQARLAAAAGAHAGGASLAHFQQQQQQHIAAAAAHVGGGGGDTPSALPQSAMYGTGENLEGVAPTRRA